MVSRKTTSDEIRQVNIIDMILVDHRYIKECLEVLQDKKVPKIIKLDLSRKFLNLITKHISAEKSIIYSKLEPEEEFHFTILEFEIEHRIIEDKVKSIRQRVSRAKLLSDELEAELNVLGNIVGNHLKEEECELLPKMNQELDEITLKEMGSEYMRIRHFTNEDLKNYPHLHDELIQWKDNVQKMSSRYLSKMDKYVENLKH